MNNADAERSPCVSRCALGAGDFCLGCARALGEIAQWSAMDGAGRAGAAGRARARMDWRRVDGGARAIMALGPKGEAGLAGGLPWRIPGELAWFKEATAGMALAMGSSSWRGLARALPGRRLAVLSREEPEGLGEVAPGSIWARGLEEVEAWAFDKGVAMCLAGGRGLWEGGWSGVEMAWITRVEGPMRADAFFEPDLSGFERVAEGPRGADGEWTWSAHLWRRR